MFIFMFSSFSPQDPLGIIFILPTTLLHLCSSLTDPQVHSPSNYFTQGAFNINLHATSLFSLLQPVLSDPGLHLLNRLVVSCLQLRCLQYQTCVPSIIIRACTSLCHTLCFQFSRPLLLYQAWTTLR